MAHARARILLEALTESEWVARTLEALGHEVIVADPNFAPMYATRSKRVKTDARDARALCEAARLGAYRALRRRSEPQRQRQAELAVRDSLVRAHTQQINLCRALLRGAGLRRWGERIARRRGSKVAAVALGRKLAGILFALWRDGTNYTTGPGHAARREWLGVGVSATLTGSARVLEECGEHGKPLGPREPDLVECAAASDDQ